MKPEKLYMTNAAVGINNYPWGQAAVNMVFPVCSDKNQFVQLSEVDMVLRFTMENYGASFPVGGIQMGVPGPAIFSQITSVPTFFTEGGTQSLSESSTSNRGDAAAALQLINYSQNNYTNNKTPEMLWPLPNTITAANFDLRIPIRFIVDFASEEKTLASILNISFAMTFRPLLNVFTPPASSPSFNVKLTTVELQYPLYKFNTDEVDLSPSIFRIPSERIITYVNSIPSGSPSVSGTLIVPGIPIKLYYFMLLNTPASSDGTVPVAYAMVPTGNSGSVVNNEVFQVAGKTLPPVQAYNASIVGSQAIGMIRHYGELQKMTGNYSLNNNSVMDYNSWLNTYRVYALDLSPAAYRDNINYTIQFATATSTLCYMVFIVLYDAKM